MVLPDFDPVLESLIFPNKSPYRDFHPLLERLFFWVKNLYRDFFLVLICVAIFFGHLSKVPSVLMGLNPPVLVGGYTVGIMIYLVQSSYNILFRITFFPHKVDSKSSFQTLVGLCDSNTTVDKFIVGVT